MNFKGQVRRQRGEVPKPWRGLAVALLLPLMAATCLAAVPEPPPPKKLLDDTKAVVDLQKAAQQAGASYQQLRNKAYQAAAAPLGLPKVQNDYNTAKALVDRLTKEQTKAVKDSPEYPKALKEADVAREKLAALREDKSISEAERRKQTDALSKGMWAPADLIRNTLDRNSALQAARETMINAEVEMTDLQKQVTGILQQDQAIAEAARKSQEVADRLNQAKKELAVSQKAYDDARRKR